MSRDVLPMTPWKALTLVGCLAIAITASAQPAPKNAAEKAKVKTKAKRAPNPAYAQVDDVPGLPRVLILGDSISIGYTVPLRKALEGQANVHRPAANCGPTTTGLKSLDTWLGTGKWDVIHFNHGLHDLKYVDAQGKNASPDNGHQQVPPEQYEKNLNAIVTRLKQTGATLIFATTTPVPTNEPQRRYDDPKTYNAIALRVMKEQGVAIDDLYAAVAPEFDKLAIQPGNVHFKPAGYEVLARQAAASIRQALPPRP